MSRPPGPKRIAAMAEMTKLKAQGLPDDEIRQALIISGLTKQQAYELLPGAPVAVVPMQAASSEVREANINGAVHFLETIAKTLKPGICDRFPELTETKSNALVWARKLRGVL